MCKSICPYWVMCFSLRVSVSARLGKIEHLNELLDAILTGPADEVGIRTFDSRPHVVKEFTVNSDTVSRSLASIASGDTLVARRGYWFPTGDDPISEAKSQ
jgi:hypothetical protein